MRPVVGPCPEFDLHDRAHVAGGGRREDGRISEQQALAIGHVGIDFEKPTGFAKSGPEPGGESGLQNTLHPLATGFHEMLETRLTLFVAGGLVGCGIAAKPKAFLIDDDVDVLRKALDKLPCL